MANLRANKIVSTTGSNAITGSVEFDGTGDYLTAPNSSDLRLGSSDFTIEGWATISKIDSNYSLFSLFENATARRSYQLEVRTNGAVRFEWWYDGSTGNTITTGTGLIPVNQWNHYAVVRNGSTLSLYINGISVGNSSVGTNSFYENTADPFVVGGLLQSASITQSWQGFISNLHIIKGTALYTSNFIPPTRKLIRLPGTVLLCCQDNNSVTTEATGKTITANGNPAARRFVPQVGSDGGLVFDGATKVNTQNYFYLATGTTEDRVPINNNYGSRGLFGFGINPASPGTIDYITISSTGNAVNFATGSSKTNTAGCASNTRGLFGGSNSPAVTNTIEFVTISSTGTITDYGDLTTGRGQLGACSSSTRGLFGGGETPTRTNIIDYVTIATTGNAIDFGDLVVATADDVGCASPTRGVFAGGYAPTLTNTINFVTISSTGNASDFGDLTAAKAQGGMCSNSTRGVFAGGVAPTVTNAIEYITIPTMGNSIDFGDLTRTSQLIAAVSSSTRGVWAGGLNPTVLNTIDYVMIMNTANALDFGDTTAALRGMGSFSNGHGGLG